MIYVHMYINLCVLYLLGYKCRNQPISLRFSQQKPIPPGSSCQQLGLATPAHLPAALCCLRRLGPGGDARRSCDTNGFLGKYLNLTSSVCVYIHTHTYIYIPAKVWYAMYGWYMDIVKGYKSCKIEQMRTGRITLRSLTRGPPVCFLVLWVWGVWTFHYDYFDPLVPTVPRTWNHPRVQQLVSRLAKDKQRNGARRKTPRVRVKEFHRLDKMRWEEILGGIRYKIR